MKKRLMSMSKEIALLIIMVILTAAVRILKVLLVTILTTVIIIEMTAKISTVRIRDFVLALIFQTYVIKIHLQESKESKSRKCNISNKDFSSLLRDFSRRSMYRIKIGQLNTFEQI